MNNSERKEVPTVNNHLQKVLSILIINLINLILYLILSKLASSRGQV